MSRPTVVFDGDCAFCTASADRLRRWSRGALDIVPWQRADLAALGLTESQCRDAVQYVGPDGARSGGAAIAVAMIAFLVLATLFSYYGLARRKWQQGEDND